MTDWEWVKPGSIDELFKLLSAYAATGEMGHRGQADVTWSLVPFLTRNPRHAHRGNSDWFAEELRSFQNFKERALRHLDGTARAHLDGPANHCEIASVAVMQHYGGPTRLLDWSFSPLVALFFAAVDHHDLDGCVWSFPWKEAVKKANDAWPNFGVKPEPDGSVNISVLAFRDDRSPNPQIRPVDFFAPTEYPVPFSRLERQKGFFTIAGRLADATGRPVDHKDKLLTLLPDPPTRYAPTRYVVRACWKGKILDRLEREGVSARALEYPAADCVGRQIAAELTR